MIRHHDLAAAALRLLRDRETSYPARVADGRMDAAAAEASLAVARAIVATWRWVMDPAMPPEPPCDADRGSFGVPAHVQFDQLVEVAAWAKRRADANLAEIYDELADWHQVRAGVAYIQLAVRIGRAAPHHHRPWLDHDAAPVLQALGLAPPLAKAA